MPRVEFEFRVSESIANELIGPDVGVRLPSGTTRKIVLQRRDPLFEVLRRAHIDARDHGEWGILSSWERRGTYPPEELAAADLMRLEIPSVFEPAGEECGTIYDDSVACPHCGAGRVQRSVLRLDLRAIQPDRDIDTRTAPPAKDIARTIADEVIVSAAAVAHLTEARVTGGSYAPIEDRGQVSLSWKQLFVSARLIELTASTRFGIDPFDDDPEGRYRCPLGHTRGLNLLSDATVDRRSWDGSDIVQSRELVGERSGLLVPSPLLFVSTKVWQLYRQHRFKGARFEPVRFA